MKFTFWFIGIVLLAAAILFVQRFRARLADRKERDRRAGIRKQSMDEADRQACLNLALNLKASTASDDPVDATPNAGRSRRSVEVPHGFDPDLPPRRS